MQLGLDDMRECVAQFQRGLVEALAFVEERKGSMTDALELAVRAMSARLQVRATCDRHPAMITPNLITVILFARGSLTCSFSIRHHQRF